GVVAEPEVRAADLRRYLRVEHRHAPDMAFVDHRAVPRRLRLAIVAPRERRVDDDALRHPAGAVALVEREVLVGISDRVAVQRVGPLDRAADGLRVRIEEELVRVEAMSPLGLVGTVDAEAVELSGTRIGEVAMPDEIGALAHRHAVRLL